MAISQDIQWCPYRDWEILFVEAVEFTCTGPVLANFYKWIGESNILGHHNIIWTLTGMSN